MGQEELFTCEFLLIKLNIVDCMTDSTELGYDLSEKIGKLDEEITALNSNLGMDVNELEGKITALETKLNALSAIFNVRHWVIYILVTLL